MELTVETLPEGVRCLRLVGRLDMKGVMEVELKFTAHVAGGKQSIIIDMSQVDYIASIGIRMLLSNVKALNVAHAKMVMLNPQPLVVEGLKLAGLDSAIPVGHDLTEALSLAK